MKDMTVSSPAEGFDREVDLVIVGAGPAGMAAALFASIEGLEVVLAEKSGQVGGTAATSAGSLWIPGNSQSQRAGHTDAPEDAARYLDRLISAGGDRNRRLRRAYLESGVEAIDHLEANTEVKFAACGRHPDYHDEDGAAVAGRAIVPQIFDGRLLGRDFGRVRPPIPEFLLFGGMMVSKEDIPRLIGRYRSVASFTYSARIFLRYLTDRLRHARGTRLTMGNALVARMFHSLRLREMPVQFDSPLVSLIADRGGVRGGVLETPQGRLRIRARKGVILATGGFAHAEDYRRRFMPAPAPAHSLACVTDEGDGIRMAEALGARIAPEEHGRGGFWTPVSVTRRADGSRGLFPHLAMDRPKPGLIAVNRAGRRFVNEANSYHDFVQAMYAATDAGDPSIPCWLICDTPFIRRYGLGLIHPGTRNLKCWEKSGYLVSAPDAVALARRIGIDASGLADSIRRNNAYAKTGMDSDFGKGTTELNRFNGDASVGPNPCLGPIGEGPLHAVEIWPAEIACSTGLSTDEDARVITPDGAPIPGLYACGNDMASVMADSYPGPGTTLGPGVVFAYRAIRRAAQGQSLPNIDHHTAG